MAQQSGAPGIWNAHALNLPPWPLRDFFRREAQAWDDWLQKMDTTNYHVRSDSPLVGSQSTENGQIYFK